MTYIDCKQYKRFIKGLLAIFIVAAAVVSCGKSGHGGSDSKRIMELRALDDSVSFLSPRSRQMISRGMASATDSISYYEYYIRLARFYILQEQSDSAKTVVNRCLAFLQGQQKGPRIYEMLGFAYNYAAVIDYNFHRNPATVKSLYHKSYSAFMRGDNKRMLPDVCANLADAYAVNSDLPNAAMWYRRALFLVDSLRLPKTENTTLLMGLGRVYQMLEDYDSAAKCYRESEKMLSQTSPNMQFYLLTNIGNFYYYKKDYPNALKTFKRLEHLLLKNNQEETFSMYVCKVNMADVLLNLNRPAEARHYVEQAERYFRERNDSVASYYAHSVQLGLALRNGNIAEARHIANMRDKPHSVEATIVTIRNKYLRDYYEKTHDYRSAFYNLKQEQEVNDSLVHNRQHMIAAELMNRFSQDTLQLHHRMEMQRKEKAVSDAHTYIIGAVAAVIVLVLVILVGIMYMHRNRLITQMSIFRLKQENARNRISPHFVFNVLNNRIVNSGEKEATELMALARLIRSNLDLVGQEMISLGEEMDFVDSYVDVESRLIGDNFEYKKEVPPSGDSAYSVRIPSMAVQILVENAIKHGLRGKNGQKTLRLSIADTTDGVEVKVADNGSGFDIRRFAESKSGHGLHILKVTVNTLNKRNKKKIRLDITNGENGGCEATLLFPFGLKGI